MTENPKFQEYVKKGHNAHLIAKLLSLPDELVRGTLKFLKTGEPPTVKPSGGRRRSSGSEKRVHKQVELAPEVARLKDIEELSFEEIGTRLNISSSTVERAYWHHRREDLRKAADKGSELPRASIHRSRSKNAKKIMELSAAGEKPASIAAQTG